MSKHIPITSREIFVTSSRHHSDKESGEYFYDISYCGNIEMEELTADDAREIIACLQHALDVNEKGGQNEKQ